MRSLSAILADCRVAFGGMTEAEKANNAEALVGKNAMSGFLALMNAAPEDIEKVSGAVKTVRMRQRIWRIPCRIIWKDS